MVAAGINIAIIHGKDGWSIAKFTENRGLSDASPNKRAALKKDHESIETKTTNNMYPVG